MFLDVAEMLFHAGKRAAVPSEVVKNKFIITGSFATGHRIPNSYEEFKPELSRVVYSYQIADS